MSFLKWFLTLGCMVGAAQAQQLEGFQTPSGNIHCAFFNDQAGVSLRCDLWQSTAKMPPKPADCDLDWGNAFGMEVRGKSVWVCHGDTVLDPRYPVLAYGKTWKKAGFVCTSLKTGLKCTNAQGHGWVLARARQVLF